MIFGESKENGIAMTSSMQPVVVDVATHGIENILVHDETNPAMAYMLSRLTHPDFPTPVGVFRSVERATYDEQLNDQVNEAIAKKGRGRVQDLIEDSHIWDVTADSLLLHGAFKNAENRTELVHQRGRHHALNSTVCSWVWIPAISGAVTSCSCCRSETAYHL